MLTTILSHDMILQFSHSTDYLNISSGTVPLRYFYLATHFHLAPWTCTIPFLSKDPIQMPKEALSLRQVPKEALSLRRQWLNLEGYVPRSPK